MDKLINMVEAVRARHGLRDLLFVATLIVLAVVVVQPAMSGEGPTLGDTQTLGLMCAVMVAAAGLNLLSGHARLISLGQGAFFAIGAYVSAWLTLDGQWHPLLAMLAALGVAAIIGALLAVASMRLQGPYFGMITLVVAILVERFLVEWPELGRLSGYPNTLDHGAGLLEPITVAGLTLDPPLFAGMAADVMIGVLIVLTVSLVGYRNVARSAWGRSLKAIGTSEHLASHLGVNVYARKVAVMAFASAYGAIGGVMYVQVFAHLQPESFNIFLSITIILAVILGGAGTVFGPIIGAVVIVYLQNSEILDPVVDLQRAINESWYLSTPGLIGLLLIITLFVLPQGLVGGASSLAGVVLKREPEAERAEREQLPKVRTGEVGDDVLLAVRGVRRNFGGIAAVGGVDLDVRKGEIHALIGPNGAGKTTLANLITGVYAVHQGEITFNGDRIDRLPTHRIVRTGIARTFQTPLIFGHETIEDNVLAGFGDTGTVPLWKAWLKPPGEYKRHARMHARTVELLHLVGLGGLGKLEAGNLSYGKQRALEIARALASDPDLLILDEPAAGLNTTETAELGRLLLLLRSQGLAMIVVEHHMDLVTAVADSVTCMNSGTVLARGSAESVLGDHAVIEAYLGAPAEENA